MTVAELIEELNKVENKEIPVRISFINVSWSGGCETCGYGAVADKEERQLDAEKAYDLESFFVIEGITR